MARRKLFLLLLAGIVGLLILSVSVTITRPTPTAAPPATAVQGAHTAAIPTALALVGSPTASSRQEVKVTRVIDGDTIEIAGGQRVRYLGIDTPEKDACYARESTEQNKQLVEGKLISLAKDISETDRYGRLLRYVYLDDLLVNEVLVKDGYAQVYTYPPDVKYSDRLLAAQQEARDNHRGLWLACKDLP